MVILMIGLQIPRLFCVAYGICAGRNYIIYIYMIIINYIIYNIIIILNDPWYA